MLFKMLVFLFAVLVSGSAGIFGQSGRQQIASVYHDVYQINSRVLNEERSIWVRVPLGYGRTSESFPVVYMLDGHAPQPSMMAGIIEQQAWGGQMPEMILVSIQNTNRSRDLTPTDDGQGGAAGIGGGDKFLRFIETEIIPLVEKNYRTRPFRIFAGHSLGGLTVIYSFITQPDLFNAYISASPVLNWDNDLIIKQAKRLFEQKRSFNKTIFIGIGDEPDYRKGFNKFRELLEKEKPKDLEYEFREFPEDNHASVVLPVYYAGLRRIFTGWTPKNAGTVADLERHYEKLSKRFGYPILIPEDMLNRIGYQFLRAGNSAEALRVFRRNIENYPDSANAYDSLGEAFEKNGQIKKARENYQKALDLATEQGDRRLADIFRANLERIGDQ